jgi:hypothetical protein
MCRVVDRSGQEDAKELDQEYRWTSPNNLFLDVQGRCEARLGTVQADGLWHRCSSRTRPIEPSRRPSRVPTPRASISPATGSGMHGARRGAVMKVQEVQEPGYMSKLLMNNTMHLLVNNHDCGRTRASAARVGEGEERQRRQHDRHLAQDFNHGDMHAPPVRFSRPTSSATPSARRRRTRRSSSVPAQVRRGEGRLPEVHGPLDDGAPSRARHERRRLGRARGR